MEMGPLWPLLHQPPLPDPSGSIQVARSVDGIKTNRKRRALSRWATLRVLLLAREFDQAGTTITFANVGKLDHTATAFRNEWDTGDLAVANRTITFTQPGMYYICTPHA